MENSINSPENTPENLKKTDTLADRSNTALEFTLEREEVKRGFYIAGKLKRRKVISIVEAVICAAVIVKALIDVISNPTYFVGYVLIAAAATVIAVVFAFPAYEEKKTVDNAMKTAVDKTIIVPLADKLRIKVPQSGANWEVKRDIVRGVKSDDLVYVIFLKGSRMVIVPRRALDTEKKQAAFDEAKAALTAPEV